MNGDDGLTLTDDVGYWERMCPRWYSPSWDGARVAEELGVDVAAVTAHHELIGLPSPQVDRLGQSQWSPADVYCCILAHRPHRKTRIPRLFPFTPALAPARFMFGQIVNDFAVHAWQPADGVGAVAMAYPAGSSAEARPKQAEALLATLPWATAVIIPCTEVCGAPDRQQQPYVYVAERNRPSANSYDWFEVANLLRVDLPWWSAHLRDREAIAAWQPGAPIQRLRPRIRHTNPGKLRDLIVPTTPHYVKSIINRMFVYLEHDIAHSYERHGGHDDLSARRGLIHAAVADVDPRARVNSPTRSEQALILHQPCADRAVAHALTESWSWDLLTDSYQIPRAAQNHLAREWLDRLQPADDPDELGYTQLRRMHDLRASGIALRDPFNAHSWIVRNDDTFYVGSAPSVPAAGHLLEASFEEAPAAGFFRDSAEIVWPVPLTAFGHYSSGYPEGTHGQQRLIETLATLRLDAGRDVHNHVSYNARSALAQFVKNTSPPWELGPGHPALQIDFDDDDLT